MILHIRFSYIADRATVVVVIAAVVIVGVAAVVIVGVAAGFADEIAVVINSNHS